MWGWVPKAISIFTLFAISCSVLACFPTALLAFFERSARDEEALTALYANFGFFSLLILPGLSGPGFSAWALAEVDCLSVRILFLKFWISDQTSRDLYSEIPHTDWSQSAILMIFSVWFGFSFVLRFRSLWPRISGSEFEGIPGLLSPNWTSPFQIQYRIFSQACPSIPKPKSSPRIIIVTFSVTHSFLLEPHHDLLTLKKRTSFSPAPPCIRILPILSIIRPQRWPGMFSAFRCPRSGSVGSSATIAVAIKSFPLYPGEVSAENSAKTVL